MGTGNNSFVSVFPSSFDKFIERIRFTRRFKDLSDDLALRGATSQK